MKNDMKNDMKNNKKKIVYIDMDNVLVDFKTGIDKLEPSIQLEYKDRLDEVPNIFSLMEPYTNAIDSVHKLAAKYDLYLCLRRHG